MFVLFRHLAGVRRAAGLDRGAPRSAAIRHVDAGSCNGCEHELTFDATTTPALATGEWVSLGLPLTDFTGLTGTGAIAQMILSGDPNTVYVDNVYFYR